MTTQRVYTSDMTTTQTPHWTDGMIDILPEYFWAKNADQKIDWLRTNLELSMRDAFTLLKTVTNQKGK